MAFRKWNTILGWATFGITFLIYALTAQRYAGFWDSGEFIAVSAKLQVSHPPGSPLYALLNRLWLVLWPDSLTIYASNLFSGLLGAVTILFLFWTISYLGKKVSDQHQWEQPYATWLIFGSSFIGSMTLVFSDSFWISATETEVYTISSAFMAATLWALLKWEREAGQPRANRWLLLIAYLIGLSVGVHIMNLAVAFPVVLIVLFKEYGFNWKSTAIGLVIGLLFFFMLNNFLFQGLIVLGVKLELWLVNDRGMPFHSGDWSLVTLLVLLLGGGIAFAHVKRKALLHTIFMSLTLYILGLTSYVMVVVRSQADLPISNEAGDMTRLLSYIRTEQFAVFADRPFLYGQYFDSPLNRDQPYLDGQPVYMAYPDSGKYVMTNDMKGTVKNYSDKYKVFFSRLYSSDPVNIDAYHTWVNITGTTSQMRQSNGQVVNTTIPDFSTNFGYFLTFQLGWLNYRYFLWNFAGRQNEVKGVGDGLYGNWESGIGLFDSRRVGPRSLTPERYANDPSKNTYYFLPFLLGVLGIIVLFKYCKPDLLWIGITFLAFGAAITLFINQLPIHVMIRERDYVLLGSFYAFSICIGLGTMGLFQYLKFKQPPKVRAIIALAVAFLAVPFLMGVKNWNDHSRGHDAYARQLAKSFLDSCEPNAILITAGDNSTFPLWCLQEVEGYRTDVRIIESEMMSLDWYTHRLRKQKNDALPVKMSMSPLAYAKAVRKEIKFINKDPNNEYWDVQQVVDHVTDDAKGIKHKNGSIPYFPTQRFRLPADTTAFQALQPVLDSMGFQLTQQVDWEYPRQVYTKNNLVLMDILAQNNWERPVCFSFVGHREHFLGLENHFVQQGLVFKLLPIAPKADTIPVKHQVLIEPTWKLLMEDLPIAPLDGTEHYIPSLNRELSQVILRPSFSNLANALLVEGRKEEAVQVMDRCIELLPDHTTAFDEMMLPFIQSYVIAGEKEKAIGVATKILDNVQSDLNLLLAYDPNHFNIQLKVIQKKMDLYFLTLKAMEGNMDKQTGKAYEQAFEKILAEFEDWKKYQS